MEQCEHCHVEALHRSVDCPFLQCPIDRATTCICVEVASSVTFRRIPYPDSLFINNSLGTPGGGGGGMDDKKRLTTQQQRSLRGWGVIDTSYKNWCPVLQCKESQGTRCNMIPPLLLRGTIVNRAYGRHKNQYIYLFLLTIFCPIYYGPP